MPWEGMAALQVGRDLNPPLTPVCDGAGLVGPLSSSFLSLLMRSVNNDLAMQLARSIWPCCAQLSLLGKSQISTAL